MDLFPSRQILRPAAGVLVESGVRIARPKRDEKVWAEQRRLAQLAHHMKAYELGLSRFNLQQFSGFQSYDSIINAITALGQGNDFAFMKSSIAPGLAGYWHSTWFDAGNPGAGAAMGATGTGTSYDTNPVTGAIQFASVSPAVRVMLSFGAMSVVACQLKIVDRVMGVGALAMTTATSVTAVSPNLSTGGRYITGIPLNVYLETSTAATSTTTAVTGYLSSYTNQGGTGSRSAGASSIAYASGLPKIGDSLGPLALQAGDTGVEASATFTVSTAATASMVAGLLWAREYATISLPANTWVERDLVLQIAGLPQIFDTACLSFLYVSSAATASIITGVVRTVYQ